MRKRRKEQLVRAAARGAKWLDKTVPGWSRRIKRRDLDLASPYYCILGQLHDGILGQLHDGGHGSGEEAPYFLERDRLGLDDDRAVWLGFTFAVLPLRGDEDIAFEILTKAWRDELKARPR